MHFFPLSVAVWMFRDPRYVVNSMVNKWGRGFFNISRRAESGADGKWRLVSLYEWIKEEAKRLTGTYKNIEDLYALYWLKRNEIMNEPVAYRNSQILFLNYADLVSETKSCVDLIMKQASESGVWKYFSTDAHLSSLNRKVMPKNITRNSGAL